MPIFGLSIRTSKSSLPEYNRVNIFQIKHHWFEWQITQPWKKMLYKYLSGCLNLSHLVKDLTSLSVEPFTKVSWCLFQVNHISHIENVLFKMCFRWSCMHCKTWTTTSQQETVHFSVMYISQSAHFPIVTIYNSTPPNSLGRMVLTKGNID